VFGFQLGKDVGHAVAATDVVKLQDLEVSLELAYLSAVGVHRILLDVERLIDLVDDDHGVVVSDEPLDSQGNSDVLSVDQSLVLDTIVGRLVVDLQDIFQVIALGRDEEYAYACSFKVQGTIEVHLPVLRLLRRWGLLGLCPLRDEVCEDLGLDGLSWIKLKLEFAQLNRPLDDAPHGVAVV
jgi:hypothetical protein